MVRKTIGEKLLFGQLDPKPITIGRDLDVLPPRKNETFGRDLDVLPPRKNETMVDVATTKDGDTIYAKYCQVKPRMIIIGIRADPSQVKIHQPPPPKQPVAPEKKKRVSQPPKAQEEKHKRITVRVVHKNINDLTKYTQTLEARLDHEKIKRLDIKDKFNALRRYVCTKIQTIMDED